MPRCYTCSKALSGAWNMTGCGGYEETGRYLGIGDGYFLYHGSPNWVYCYCLECWKKQVLSLSFVSPDVAQLGTQNINLNTELAKKNTEISNLNAQIAEKITEITNLNAEVNKSSTEIANLKSEISKKSTEISDLNGEIAKLKQDLNTKTLVTDFLKSQSAFENVELQNLNKEIAALKSIATDLQSTKSSLSKDVSSVSSLTSELKAQVSRHELSATSDSKETDHIGLDLVFYERVRRHLLCCQKDLSDFDALGRLGDLHSKLKKAFSVCLETEWKAIKSNTQTSAKSLLECLEKEQKNLEQMLSLLESGLEANRSAVKPAEVQQMVDTTRAMKAHSVSRIEALKRLQVEADEVTPILTT